MAVVDLFVCVCLTLLVASVYLLVSVFDVVGGRDLSFRVCVWV